MRFGRPPTAKRGVWARLLRGEHGTSATEFALFAPIIIFSGLAMADMGIALYQRMSLDYVVRAGAKAAMSDPGEPTVLKVLQGSAKQNFANDPLELSVERYCACGEDRSASTDCTNLCPGPAAPFVYYRMDAAKDYSGVLLPKLDLRRQLEVQTR